MVVCLSDDTDSNGTVSESELNQILVEMQDTFASMKLTNLKTAFPRPRDVWPQFNEKGREITREEFVSGMITQAEVVKRLGFIGETDKGFTVSEVDRCATLMSGARLRVRGCLWGS